MRAQPASRPGDQDHAFFDPALFHRCFDLRRDVNVFAMLASVELEIFGMKFHGHYNTPPAAALSGRAPGDSHLVTDRQAGWVAQVAIQF